jgi:hypothetical protein
MPDAAPKKVVTPCHWMSLTVIGQYPVCIPGVEIKIWRYSKICRVSKIIRPYLEMAGISGNDIVSIPRGEHPETTAPQTIPPVIPQQGY